jgi:hypothetical protein
MQQKLGIIIEGILRFRSQDEQAILLEGLSYEEFCELDDDLHTIVNTDLPHDI